MEGVTHWGWVGLVRDPPHGCGGFRHIAGICVIDSPACLCPASSSQAGFCMLKTSASDPEIRAIRVHVQADSSSSPVPLASLPRIPPDVPNRCNLRPLTPKKPEKALYGVSPQRCCIPYMVCRGLSRFRFPKRTCYYFKRIEARGVWEPCGRNWRLSTYCGDVSKARSM